MRIAIVGAGAMGYLFTYLLSKEKKADVWILDNRPDRTEKVQKEGLEIEGVSGEHLLHPNITVDPAVIGIADLVILCVKGPATYEASLNAKPLFGPDTPILTLQNGLGNMEEIERALGPGRALGGTSSMGATVLAPNRIRHAGWGENVIGEPDGTRSERAEKVLALFQDSGLEASLTDNLAGLLWSKLIINVGINALTALSRLHNGQLLNFEGTRKTMDQAVAEATQVAGALKINLLYDNPVEKVAAVCQATAGNISSMLQDVLKEKKTEIDQINGAVIREAAKHNIPTPVNQTLRDLVKALEESYAERIKD